MKNRISGQYEGPVDKQCKALDHTGEGMARYRWVCCLDEGHDGPHRDRLISGDVEHEWPNVVTYRVTDIENNPFAEYGATVRAQAEDIAKASDEIETNLAELLEDMDAVAKSHSEPLLRTFRFEHLPRGPIRSLSAEFAGLATIITEYVPGSAERTLALRNLWDAKNYAVFAASELLRGKTDDDGQVVGAERVREGSPEIVRMEDGSTREHAPSPRCEHTWPHGPLATLLACVLAQHECEYVEDHGGRHRCRDCGDVA